MEFTDEKSQETLRLEFDGVHFLSEGSIVGLVEPFGLVQVLLHFPAPLPERYIGNPLTFVYSPRLYHRTE